MIGTPLHFLEHAHTVANVGIIPKVKLVPEVQPRDTNDRQVLSLLMTVGRKHILIARSVAEGPNFFKCWFIILKFGLEVINYD